MVADHLIDDEAQELLGKFRVKIGFLGKFPQARDLPRLALGIGRGQGGSGLVFAHGLGDAEALGQHVDERCINIVDALAIGGEHRVGRLRGRVGGGLRGIVHRLQT